MDMGKMMIIKLLILPFLFYVTVVFSFAGCCRDKIEINGPTKLYRKPDLETASGNKIITVLQKGIHAEIINIRYSKEFMFYKVKTKDGKIGYVMYGDDFKVISK